MQLVIKSNAKTSVTTYIHATTYVQVKPIFTQALMIWLVILVNICYCPWLSMLIHIIIATNSGHYTKVQVSNIKQQNVNHFPCNPIHFNKNFWSVPLV